MKIMADMANAIVAVDEAEGMIDSANSGLDLYGEQLVHQHFQRAALDVR